MNMMRFERVTHWRSVTDEQCSGAASWPSAFQIIRNCPGDFGWEGWNPFTLLFRPAKPQRHLSPVEVIYP